MSSSLSLRGGGGTAERTFQMSRFLARRGVACTVLTLGTGLDAGRVLALAPATVVALDSLWERFFVPRVRWKTIRKLVETADVIHLIGHWGVLNAMVYLAARAVGKPYVVCPAGALPLFGRSAWLKRLYNLLVGKAVIRNAAGWIAVTPGEFSHFERYGVPASRVMVIPNGVSEEDFPPTDRATFLRSQGLADAPFILFMGRLNPIKGPDLLLEAFARVCDRFPGHQLVFAGPDGGMLESLRARAAQSGLGCRVHFLGHLDGTAKAGAYRFAQLLVVPSRQEAMSIVALEAGICGTPVLLTDQCGFDEIAAVDRRLIVAASGDGLAVGLSALLQDSDALRETGLRLEAFVRSRYAWPIVVGHYVELYRRILAAGPLP
ncbi:glycosyltransferase [Polaromonas sp. YR568]|uniref:glycosyltransferase n=1 Tax=Polaromonas sp. YR568 TaxID=1855301 RepID=UPI00398BF39F